MIDEGRTTVAFETPHRIHAALDDIAAVAPDVEIAVCRELTKLHEEVFRGSPSEARAHFTNPRGEFTLVIGARPQPDTDVSDTELLSAFERLESEDVSGREAVDRVSGEYGWGGTGCIGYGWGGGGRETWQRRDLAPTGNGEGGLGGGGSGVAGQFGAFDSGSEFVGVYA